MENKALILLCLEQPEAALSTLQEALAQRLPGDIFEFDSYDLLAAAPNPPTGLAQMRRVLETAVAVEA